jgi:hypothetical protein
MFSDIANVFRIREALWRHRALGSSSIMVGAGFSRNADPLSSTARPMPNWQQMAEALCHPLYPMDDARRKSALRESTGTSGFLRLAQEYQTAFGPSALNDCIRNLVPDLDYRPGDLHKRLIRLPWADVFSTNWDTLLERACADVFDRSYDVVRTVGEIPFTTRPRIVKLHGSFPGHDPFIFTEEDYRTYPVQFSPFVNLAQQSMMETIFCLLGFSGDDPNFLHWSGWVRDNLKGNAPKIYLVGWLDLSIHRRRMLEARNVMPVDLSTLPGADKWPTDLQHRYATEWFIAAMELGKPYVAAHWPSPPEAPTPTPSYLGVVPTTGRPVPRHEPANPRLGQSGEERANALREAIDAWAFNRERYPGWLVAPEHVRERLRHYLEVWITEFSQLSLVSPLERLQALSELAWRMERALLPFPAEHEDSAFATLASIDRSTRTIGGTTLPETVQWADILKGADTLALTLVRNARHAGDHGRFERALQILTMQSGHNAEIQNAITHEQCLWDLAVGDLTSLLTRLDSWMPALGETLWSLRKAGLLAEMQEHARACALLETTLAQIRRTRRRDVDDLVSLSLESWALFLALAYEERSWTKGPALPADMPEPFERWRALGIVDCDAFSEYQSLKRLLEANKPQQPALTKTRGFDLDHSGITHHMGRGPSPTIVAAYQMVMLAETTGIPPIVNHLILFQDGLKVAARTLATSEPWLASQLAARITGDDKLLDTVFSRAQVARLPFAVVTLLRDALLKRVTFGLAQLGSAGREVWEGSAMAGSALEILSRIAVRLGAEQLRALLDGVLTHYRSPIFRRMSTSLGAPLAHLMARILESLPRTEVLNLLPKLFALPLPSEVGPSLDELRWRDPVRLLPQWFDGSEERIGPREAPWEGIISRLLVAAKGASTVDRAVAVNRLFNLYRWQLLNESEQKAFAAALWEPTQRDSFGIPQHTSLRPWVLLTLPEEHPGQAREALLRFIMERSRPAATDVSTRLAEIGDLLEQFEVLRISIDLSEDLQANLRTLVATWAAHRTPNVHEIDWAINRRDERDLETLEGVAAILPRISVSDDLFEKIWDKAKAMDEGRDGGVHAFLLYPALAQRRPEGTAELIDRLRRSLVSDQEDDVRRAVQGLYMWLRSQETQPDAGHEELDDLVREVGIAIAARRLVLLRPALEFARWLFDDGPVRLRQLIVHDCDTGLVALLEEASYRRSEQSFDVPEIRAACFRLASAMVVAGFADKRGVAGWLAAAKDDPLPEVRNAQARKSGINKSPKSLT